MTGSGDDFMQGAMGTVKGLVKSSLGRLIFGMRAQDWILSGTAPVIVFHRIMDGPPGNFLSYSPEDFRRLCVFLSRHFQVVSLGRVVEKLKLGEPFHREVAVTFDDGYRDNWMFAAPILEDLNLPATFFVTTRFIGSLDVPWWDRALGLRFEWMTWNEVRELHGRGFEIGSHTATHADLGTLSEEQALEELRISRLELEDRLSAPVTLFAYPYGGAGNMSPGNRKMVEVAGYSCCCSCFGGINDGDTDPYHLRRIPISNWYRSPHDFGFQLAMRRV